MSDAAVNLDAWQEILGLTAAIQEKAVSGEWEDVTGLDAERRRRLEAFFASSLAAPVARQVRVDVLGILESDRQVMELARGMREAIGEELRAFRQGIKAASAYLDQPNGQDDEG